MFARTLLLLTLVFCFVAFVGCTGDQGPVGPAGPAGTTGPAGPSVVLCSGEIDGGAATVVVSWPADVTIAVRDLAGPGYWNVTLTGTFPVTRGTVLTTNVDNHVDRSMTAFITGWSATSIYFNVGMWNIEASERVDSDFSFLVLAAGE